MYISSVSTSLLFLLSSRSTLGFAPNNAQMRIQQQQQQSQFQNQFQNQQHRNQYIQSSIVILQQSTSTDQSESETTTQPPKPTKPKKLTLLTFDLDDTLYPLAKVMDEANTAVTRIMATYGYDTIEPLTIVNTGRDIRERMAITDPERSATLSHTDTRRLAIREEMEKIIFERKLKACAEDWATQVADLSPLVVQNAKTWATTSVTESVVEAVLNAWEMERHHAAERHLFPDVVDTFQQIKEEYPNVVIGAVTDGRANPALMTFTLAKYFDFCINWEDHQAGRKKFFTDLKKVEQDADLRWIYNLTKEKGEELVKAGRMLRSGGEEEDEEYEAVWIHVGDDLALDVGGSKTSGAKTIWAELDDNRYGQTARHRFALNKENQPKWSITSMDELELMKPMNAAALDLVDQKVAFITHIPEAISNILEMEE
jgi:FMN phosphatase YigB (HAD superfamily)